MSAHWASRRIIVYSVLLIIAILMAITGTGLYRIQNLSTGLTEVVNERDVQIALMHNMRQVARERSITLQSMMITKDPFAIDEYAMEMSAAAARYMTSREELLTHEMPEPEHQLLQRQHAQTVETASSQNRIIDHLRNSEYEAAANLLFFTTLPGQRRAMAMMDEFITLKRQQNLDSLQSTSQEIAQTHNLMLILSGLGVLVSVTIAMLIDRRIGNEIRRRLHTEHELRHSELRERTIRENIIDGLLTLDGRGRILSCNKACETIFGYDREVMKGKNAAMLLPPSTTKDRTERLARHLNVWGKRRLGTGREVMGQRSNGEAFPAEIDLSKIEFEGETVYIVVIRDITEKKASQKKLQRFNQELERRVIKRTEELARTNDKLRHEIHERVRAQHELTHLATHDTLTGLPNRSLFNEHLGIVLHTASRHQREVALLFLDLDGFKKINDTYGHDAGDRLLQTLGNRMKACIRKEDILARMGGDEFTVILSELQNKSGAELVAQKLIQVVNKPVTLDGHPCQVGVSIGIALFPRTAQDPDSLLRLADDAMYEAKSDGRNTYHFSSSSEHLPSRAETYPLF